MVIWNMEGVDIMNKRIRKKKARQYCNKTHKHIGEWQCDKCGWDSLEDPSHSQITWSEGDFWGVHCKCPICGNQFDYTDGI